MSVDTPRIVLVVFLLLFLFLSPDTRTPSFPQQLGFEEQIRYERHALDLLNASSYSIPDYKNGTWLNLTGFRKDDGYAWNMLSKVQHRAKEQLRAILEASPVVMRLENNLTSEANLQGSLDSMRPFREPSPVFKNITGMVTGHWARSNIQDGHPLTTLNLPALAPGTAYISQSYKRNVTGKSGDLRIKMDEARSQELKHLPGMIREVKAEVMIRDRSTGDEYEFSSHGVHYPSAGSVVLVTTSEK